MPSTTALRKARPKLGKPIFTRENARIGGIVAFFASLKWSAIGATHKGRSCQEK